MKIQNLFGEQEEVTKPQGTSKYMRHKIKTHYRDADSEKSCKNCDHRKTYEYHNKYYHKCELIGTSNSAATDIRLKKVCDYWTAEPC